MGLATIEHAVLPTVHRRTGQGGQGGQLPPWIWETSKIRADGMGNSGIRGTEFFEMKVLAI